MADDSGYDPDVERVQESAERRQDDRTERIEDMMNQTAELLGDQKYPVTSEELAVEYADQPLDLPNETETLGSVFDRLVDERFESADEAREAVYGELTGRADADSEYNDERPLEELDDTEQDDLAESGGTDT